MARAIVYIDSRNLHYQLERNGIESMKLDYRELSKMLTQESTDKNGRTRPAKKIEAIKFYCAKFRPN